MRPSPALQAAELVRAFRESCEEIAADELGAEQRAALERVLESTEDLAASVALLIESLDRSAGAVPEIGPTPRN